MSEYSEGRADVRISAGTAIKIGFFGAFGALLFSLIISVIFGALALILGFSGMLSGLIPGLN